MSAPDPADRLTRIWPTIALLAVALAILVTISWYANRNLDLLNATADSRAAARSGRLYLEQALSLYKDVETASRGFVITGQDHYLEPFVHATARLPDVVADLKRVVGDDLPAGMTWNELDELMQRRTDLARQAIEARRERGADAIQDIALFDEGKRVMDLLRYLFARIDSRQAQRIDEKNVAIAALRRQASGWSLLAATAACAFIGLSILLLIRERRIRLRLEALLRRANARLETRVTERTAELASAKERIAAFAVEQDRAIEAERRHLSREVHDQIGQVFTAIQMIAASLPAEAFPPGQAPALRQALEMGIASSRRITAQLRPPLLDDLGLAAALDHYLEHLAGRGDIRCTVAIADQETLDASHALTLFRIVQEAVTNVLRHAQAGRIDIAGHAESDAYILTIADDGRGFAPETVRPGAIGLAGMRERAALNGGECRIESRSGGGTIVEVRLPLHGSD